MGKCRREWEGRFAPETPDAQERNGIARVIRGMIVP